MVFTTSSTSFDLMQMGMASIPANSLKRRHLPSITGILASGPISPSPSTAVPLVITATTLPLAVKSKDFTLSFSISKQGAATPGV